MGQIAVAFALTCVAVGVLFLWLRRRLPAWSLLTLALLPEIFVYLYSDDLRVVSTHGFLHGSIVYRLMTSGVVPDCPVLAHEPLLYPWAHHMVVGWLSSLFDIGPGTGFAAMNIAALALTLFFVYRLGMFLAADRVVATLAAAFSVFGVTFMNYRVLGKTLLALTGMDAFVVRNPVVVKKFTNLNSNSLGYVFFALFLYAAARIFTETDWRKIRLAYAELGIAVAGAALFYPITWMSIGVCLVPMALVALYRRGSAAIPTILRAAVVAGGATALCAPYIFVIAGGKAQQMYLFAPDLGFLVQKAVAVACALGPAAAILVWKRDAVRAVRARSGDAFYYLATVPVTAVMLYVFIGTDWSTNEYKWLGIACFSTGVILSVAMAALFRERPAVFVAITLAFLFSFGEDIGGKVAAREFDKADDYVEDGSWLRHADPLEDSLYRFIADHTAADAVLLDNRLTAPMFTRRSLYVGIDARGVAGNLAVLDGWQIDPDIIMDTYFAYPREVVDRRRAVARAIYSGEPTPIPDAVLEVLRADVGESGVFVIARDRVTNEKLGRDPRFERLFATSAASVYQLIAAS